MNQPHDHDPELRRVLTMNPADQLAALERMFGEATPAGNVRRLLEACALEEQRTLDLLSAIKRLRRPEGPA
jgi:hypothetical protein